MAPELALLLRSLDFEPPSSAFWKRQCVLTLDASTSRWTGLSGWQPVDKKVTGQQEPFFLFPLQLRTGLQSTGCREVIESALQIDFIATSVCNKFQVKFG